MQSWLDYVSSHLAPALDSIAALRISQELALFLAAEVLLLAVLVMVLRRRRAQPKPEAAPASSRATPMAPEPSDGFGGYIAGGTAIAAALIGGVGGWAATFDLAGAVIASGTVVVDSNVKKVQHPTGGIVGDIRVRDGDKVSASDILVKLDETITRANLQVITKQLDELAMRQARLRAERDELREIQVPPLLASRQDEPGVRELIAGERALFASRSTARLGQKSQLAERIAQLKEEIGGVNAQSQAKAEEVRLVRIELEGQKQLWDKNLLPITKYTQTQREATRLDGERAQLVAAMAQARGKIAEIDLQILQIDQDLRTEVVRELREAQGKEAELEERRVAAVDQLRRVEIRAPIDGVVHQLAVHTVGGVINQSEPVMLIVPEGDRLVIEVRIAPQDIDHVRLGQSAAVRFPAFNQRTTPEFNAEVHRVSADLSRDPQQGLAFYVARLVIPAEEMKRLGNLQLVPGMPAEVYIKTAERTALSYLMKPLQDQFHRAFREYH